MSRIPESLKTKILDLIKDTQFAENSQMVTYIIIAVWWLPFYVLTKRSGSAVIANNKKK